MARIQLGPLAAQISGSIGEVEFRWTRDGQVAQSKTISNTWTTVPALATKARFRRAMELYSHLDDYIRLPLARAARAEHKAASQSWVSATYNVLNGKEWYYPDTYNSTYHLQILAYRFDFPGMYLTLGPYVAPADGDARLGFITASGVPHYWDANAWHLIDEIEHFIPLFGVSSGDTLVLFPRFKDSLGSIGHSTSLLLPEP